MARIAFFCFDIAEAAQIRRIESVQSLGHTVVSMSFRRSNMNDDFQPSWPNVDLGRTENRNFLKRLGRMAVGLVRALKQKAVLKDSDVWIARNLDLLAIAAAMRMLTGRREVALVYECLDIHGMMTGQGWTGAMMRWIERRLLKQTRLLIISSPGFMREYFDAVQEYSGPVALIENKLWLGETHLPRPTKGRRPGEPRVIGWVGSLRCPESLAILAETASRMRDSLRIEFHGNVHRHALPDFDAVVDVHPNITYHGPYRYPDDLRAIYGACDLVWAQDLWQRGTNSDWLLPNRIYEASYFGCPSIALEGTETATCVKERSLGFVVDDASTDALVGLLGSLGSGKIFEVSNALLGKPDTAFRLDAQELEAALLPLLSDNNEAGTAKSSPNGPARGAESIRLQ